MSRDIVTLAQTIHRAEGRPVVFLHGFGHNRHVFSSLVETLDPSLRAIALDLRGHGDAGWSTEGRYGVEDYARDLPAALDALGLAKAVIVAHSLGGQAATLFAARHPSRVEALVLLDTGPGLAIDALTRIASDTDSALGRFERVDEYRGWLEMLHPLCDASTLDAFAENSVVRRLDGRYELKLDPGVMTSNMEAAQWRALEQRLEESLTRIDCPSLLVRGGLSSVLPLPAAERITKTLLSDGRLHTLERAGHAVMLDDAEGLRRAIESFIAEVEARPALAASTRERHRGLRTAAPHAAA